MYFYTADPLFAGGSVIYITDFKGQEIKRFGTFGKGDGEFREPSGVSVSPQGHVYIADSKNDRIQVRCTSL